MSKPKRHHYLPQLYLDGFTDRDGFLWVYDLDEHICQKQTPKNTAVIGHYYTFRGEDGQDRTDIEKIFANNIENKVKPIITKLDNGDNINPEEKETLSIFCSFMITRVPRFEKWVNISYAEVFKSISRSMLSSEDEVAEILELVTKETGEQLDADPKALLEFIHGDAYEMKFPRGHSLRAMLLAGLKMAPYLLQMNWCFWSAPDDSSFITTDSPFLLITPEDYDPEIHSGYGLITPGTRKIMPLSSKTCLAIGDRGMQMTRRVASKNLMLGINLETVANSWRYLIANNKSLLETLVQYIESQESDNGRDCAG